VTGVTTLGLTADSRALQNAGTPLYDALVAEYRTALRCVPGEADNAAGARRRALLAAMPRRPVKDGDAAAEASTAAVAELATGGVDDEQEPEEAPVRTGAHGRQNADRRTRPA
jgi:hypothetical protein